jgi:hypothetical protein
MRDVILCWSLAASFALAATSTAETFLIQSGQDSSPYSFTPNTRRGFLNTAYAFTAFDQGANHSFEYYIQWNLPEALFEPGVEVVQAFAWVYHGYSYTLFGDFSDEVGELNCHEVLEPWSESTLTWNNRPAIGTWFDRRTEILNLGLLWCDVTDVVAGWIANPGTNHGIALTNGTNRVMGFYSFQDGSVSPNFRPSLMVETVPEPAAVSGLFAGGALLALLDRRRARRLRCCN